MATFNGACFIREQLQSILHQLSIHDELIIADDCSNDETLNIIHSFKDARIRILNNKFRNPARNFESAIKVSNGDVIVLSDQDDIWYTGRLTLIRNYFQNHLDVPLLLSLNADIFYNDSSEFGSDMFSTNHFKKGIVRNLIKNGYTGCTFAFSKSLKKYILPFPAAIPMHDSWIGIIAELKGRVSLHQDTTMAYRVHSNNTSLKRRPFVNKIRDRIGLMYSVLKFTLFDQYRIG